MFGLDKTWQLDSRLEKDSIFIRSRDVWQIRLINDKRWPWIIIVPLVHDAVDLEDIGFGLLAPMFQEASRISRTLKVMEFDGTPKITKTNVATIGNIVNQFHLHIVGRHDADPNWPNSVWGYGDRKPYTAQESRDFIANFEESWKQTLSLWERL